MKGLAVVFCVVAAVVAYPYPQFYERQSSDPTDDVEEVDITPYGMSVGNFGVNPPRGILGPGFIPDAFNLNPFNSDDFARHLQETLSVLQDRVDSIVKKIPAVPQNETMFKFGDGPVQNKSTSTKKVIDGHVVTVNETTYSTGDGDNTAFFHFEVVEVEPEPEVGNRKHEEGNETPTESSNKEETEPVTTEAAAGKTEENNEIPKDKVSFAEWDSSEILTNENPSFNEVDSETFNELDDVSVFEPNQMVDLSGDVLVNKLVSDQAKASGLFMVDPDAELLDLGNKKDNRQEYFQYSQKEEDYPIVRI